MKSLEEFSEEIPKWNNIVKIEKAKVVSVNWADDFKLLDLSNDNDKKIRENAYDERKMLYGFLERTRAISKIGNPGKGIYYSAYKGSVRRDADYRIGPSFNGNVYYFKDKKIAEDWVSAFAERNKKWTVFVYRGNQTNFS